MSARAPFSGWIEVMLVVRGDLLELIFQGSRAGHTVHELEVPLLFVIQAGIIDDGVSNRLVNSAGNVERHSEVPTTCQE